MKKKALLLASMGALACTVGVTALAVGGANQLDAFAVKADPTEYSVTFDGSESTTVEDKYGQGNCAICTTTAGGNKVGVVGFYTEGNSMSFHGTNFLELHLADFTSTLVNNDAYEFHAITGFAISFEGGSVVFNGGSTTISSVTSGAEYKGLSITPTGYPRFASGEVEGNITISSLTIWYSC